LNFFNLSNNFVILPYYTDEGCVTRKHLILHSDIRRRIVVRFIDVRTSCQLEKRIALYSREVILVEFNGERKFSQGILLGLKGQFKIFELRFLDYHEIVDRIVPESFSNNAF
jgi:hypothetical protein